LRLYDKWFMQKIPPKGLNLNAPISPRTGKLGGFGETDGYILELARKSFASGLKVGEKTYGVDVLDRDTQSDPSRAGQLAKTLINSDKIDMMLVVSPPETINPVADACEAAGVPCMSTVMPWEAWYFGRGAKPGQPSPFKWTFHFGFGGGEFFKTYVSQWSLIETNKKVGVLYPNDADGNAIRESRAGSGQGGFTIEPALMKTAQSTIRPRSRSSRQRNADFNTFRSRWTSLRFTPDSRATPRWSRSPRSPRPGSSLRSDITRQSWLQPAERTYLPPPPINPAHGSRDELADGYVEGPRKVMWRRRAMAAVADAAGVSLQNLYKVFGSKAALAKAMSTLKTVTIDGPIDFTSGPVPNVSPGPILGTQWVKAPTGSRFPLDYPVTENATDPNVPIQAKLRRFTADGGTRDLRRAADGLC
jgi:branched-chain amino acid transport system substrate-binding protein